MTDDPRGPATPPGAKAVQTAGPVSRRSWRRSLISTWSGLSTEGKLLLVGIGSFVVLATLGSYLRYLTFQTNAWDLGINMQVLWTTAFRGRFLYYTAELSWNASGSLMGVHFVPILFALVPIYRVFPSALTLFLIQSLAVGAGAVPLYLLAARRTSARAALLITFAYLVSAPLLGAVFFDFHAESFVPLAGLGAWYAWETRRPALLAAAATALLAIIEFTPLILGAIALMFLAQGVWARWQHKGPLDRSHARWSLWLPLFVLGLSAVLLPIWFLVPKLVAPSTPPYGQTGALGGSLGQILANLVNPTVLANVIAADGLTKVAYLGVLVVSGLVLWVLRPVQFLPAVPWMLVVLVTPASNYHVAVGNQYLFLVVPFLFPATASGYELVKARWLPRLVASRAATSAGKVSPSRPRIRRLGRAAQRHGIPLGLLVVFVIGQVVWSPLSPASASWENVYELPNGHTRLLTEVTGMIPSGSSVSAQPNLFPPFANRLDSYPYLTPGVRYVFCDVSSGWFSSILPPPARNPSWDLEMRGLATTYGLMVSRGGVLLFEDNYTGAPVDYSPWDVTPALGSYLLGNATRVGDRSAPLGDYLAPAAVTNSPLWSSPLVGLAPGNYSATLWLRDTATGGGGLGIEATYFHGTEALRTATFPATFPANNWTSVVWNFALANASTFQLNGFSGPTPSGVQFGGVELAELSYWG